MSFRLVKKVLNSDQVEGMEKLVLAILADFVNEDRDSGSWPSKSRVALLAGCTPRHVTRIIRQLESDGILKTVRQAGLRGTNRYYIRLNQPVDNSQGGDIQDTLGVTFETSGGDMGVTPGVTFETQRGDMGVTRIDKEQIRINKATGVAAPSGAGGAPVGNWWECKTARELPCNHDSTITVNRCPDCFAIYRRGEWKPETLGVA